ncbi:MAG: hypothetical protein ACYTGF_13500 [Planctomycetota bacterium]
MCTPRSLACGMIASVLGLAASPARAHVELNAPNGWELLEVGSVFTITWTVLAEHGELDWDLSYSTSGTMGPWIPLADNLPGGDPTPQSVHTYEWTIPDAVAQFVWVRVIQDNHDYEDLFDISDLPFSIVPACPWDLDGSGDVGITDFLNLLAVWGTSGVPADFDGGGVGITDFLVLLAHWGPCP